MLLVSIISTPLDPSSGFNQSHLISEMGQLIDFFYTISGSHSHPFKELSFYRWRYWASENSQDMWQSWDWIQRQSFFLWSLPTSSNRHTCHQKTAISRVQGQWPFPSPCMVSVIIPALLCETAGPELLSLLATHLHIEPQKHQAPSLPLLSKRWMGVMWMCVGVCIWEQGRRPSICCSPSALPREKRLTKYLARSSIMVFGKMFFQRRRGGVVWMSAIACGRLSLFPKPSPNNSH